MIIENIIDGATMTRIFILLIKRASRTRENTEFVIFMIIVILILLGKLVLDVSELFFVFLIGKIGFLFD